VLVFLWWEFSNGTTCCGCGCAFLTAALSKVLLPRLNQARTHRKVRGNRKVAM